MMIILLDVDKAWSDSCWRIYYVDSGRLISYGIWSNMTRSRCIESLLAGYGITARHNGENNVYLGQHGVYGVGLYNKKLGSINT